MKKNATVKIVLDPQSNEVVRTVKLRITFNRVTKFRAIPSEIKLTETEFSNEKLKKTKEVMTVARKAHSAAQSIGDELGASFTWIEFDLRYKKIYICRTLNTETYGSSYYLIDCFCDVRSNYGCKPQ